MNCQAHDITFIEAVSPPKYNTYVPGLPTDCITLVIATQHHQQASQQPMLL